MQPLRVCYSVQPTVLRRHLELALCPGHVEAPRSCFLHCRIYQSFTSGRVHCSGFFLVHPHACSVVFLALFLFLGSCARSLWLCAVLRGLLASVVDRGDESDRLWLYDPASVAPLALRVFCRRCVFVLPVSCAWPLSVASRCSAVKGGSTASLVGTADLLRSSSYSLACCTRLFCVSDMYFR